MDSFFFILLYNSKQLLIFNSTCWHCIRLVRFRILMPLHCTYTYISIVYTHYLSNQHFRTFCRGTSWTHCSYLPPIQDCHSVWQAGRQTLEDWFRYTARRCTLGKPIDRMGIQVLFTTFFFIASINLMYIFHVYSCTFPFFSSDYQQGLTMKFGKKEEAISFAEKQGKKKRFVR